MKHLSRQPDTSKKIPLWKSLVIILVVIAMPLFFSLVRDNQIQQALINSEPVPEVLQQAQSQDVNHKD